MSIVFPVHQSICKIVKEVLDYDIVVGKHNEKINPALPAPIHAASEAEISALGVREKYDILLRTRNVIYVVRYDTPPHTLDGETVIPRSRKYTVSILGTSHLETTYDRLVEELTALALGNYANEMEIVPDTSLGNYFCVSVEDEDEWERVPEILSAFIRAAKAVN
jgi:hypothetical protein